MSEALFDTVLRAGGRDRLRKLMYRVVFPFDLKLRNTVDECPEADDLYHLLAVVVHVGAGPNHGAYVPLPGLQRDMTHGHMRTRAQLPLPGNTYTHICTARFL